MVIVRRAMTEGLFGDSRFWKVVAFAIIARRTMPQADGLDPNTVAIEKHPARRDRRSSAASTARKPPHA